MMSNELLSTFVDRSPPDSLGSSASPPSPAPCCSYGENEISKHDQFDIDCHGLSNTRELKVDKRILEIMKKGGDSGMNVPSLTTFFGPIRESGGDLDFSSSFRDRQGNSIPIVKVASSNPNTLEKACATIMQFLDPHRDKMTFNIDVPSSDHSFIIGKDGSRIKGLSKKTGCHIHLPDCNKLMGKKSNKITIAGTSFESIEYARDQIRKQLPLNVMFVIRVNSRKMPLLDASSSNIQNIKRVHQVDVNFYGSNCDGNFFGSSGFREITVSVKGTRIQLDQIDQAVKEIYQIAYDSEYRSGVLSFEIIIDISSNNHQFVRGKGNCNLKVITNRTGARIFFPSERTNIVRVRADALENVVMCWQELMGFVPLVLSFDLNLPENIIKDVAAQVEKSYNVNVRIREKLASSIFTLFIKTQERHSLMLRDIRDKFLDRKKLEVENIVPICRSLNPSSLNQVQQVKSLSPQFEQPSSDIVANCAFNDRPSRAFGVDLSNQSEPEKLCDFDFMKFRSMLNNPIYAHQMVELTKHFDQNHLPSAFNALNNNNSNNTNNTSGYSAPPGFQSPIPPLPRNNTQAYSSYKPPPKVSPPGIPSVADENYPPHHNSADSGMGSFWTGNPTPNRNYEKENQVPNYFQPNLQNRAHYKPNYQYYERKPLGPYLGNYNGNSPPHAPQQLFNPMMSPIAPVPSNSMLQHSPERDYFPLNSPPNRNYCQGNQNQNQSVNSSYSLFNMQQPKQTPAIPLADNSSRCSIMEQTSKNIMDSSFSNKSTTSSYPDSGIFNNSLSSTSTPPFPVGNLSQNPWINEKMPCLKRSNTFFDLGDYPMDDFKENM